MTDSPKSEIRLSFRSAAILAGAIAFIHLLLLVFGEGNRSLLPLKDGFVISISALATAASLAAIRHANAPPLGQYQADMADQSRRAVWTHSLPFLGIGAVFLLFVREGEYIRQINYSLVTVAFGFLIALMFIRQKMIFDESNELLARSLSEVAERKRAEEDLQRAKGKAEFAARVKTKFLANMSG